jgi:hypothetical protein
MSGAIPPLPNMPSWRGAQLKHRDNFILYILLLKDCVIDKGVEILPLPLYSHFRLSVKLIHFERSSINQLRLALETAIYVRGINVAIKEC